MTNPKIKYDIEAEAIGEANVESLAKAMGDLAQTLEGDLKTQALAAADALRALGDKQSAVATFQALTNESGALGVELAQAEAGVRQLGGQLAKASAATQTFATAELQAKAALAGTRGQLEDARKSYEALQADTLGAARSTDEYRDASAQARTTIQGLAAEVKQQARSLKEAESSTRAAQQAENALSSQYQASGQALQQVRGALQDKNAALDAGRDKLKSMGIEATNLAQAERNLGAAVAAVRQEVIGLGPAYAKVAQASSTATTGQIADQKALRSGMASIAAQLQSIQNIAALALGGGFAGGLLKDVTDTADAFNNLAARIKLSTGEGAAFEQGFQRVQQVAMGTSSALESTGILFARILQAGKEFNLTQDAALGLTQSINQAVQLSGASAQASDAAITQLIQGLQSGVLRGEEFNSVMEQAPRLAQALAAGLGVTTGELRKMAQAGELSAKTVITSLQSQSAALQAEFVKMPATVGRAITNLQTQWSLFIGGLDASTSATSYVAAGINSLAGNLDTLARVAGVAGAALTASLAVQGAAALRAYAAEAALAAGATNLLSASIAKVPKAVNIVVGVTGFEIGWQVGEMLRENSEWARKLGVGIVGYFEVVVNSLRLAKDAASAVFTSDTVDAAFDRYMQRNQQVREQIQAMMVDAEQAPAKVGTAVDAAAMQMQGLGGAAQAAGAQVARAGAAGAAGFGAMGKAAADTLGIFKELLAEAERPQPKQGAVASIALQLVEARNKGLDLDALLRRELPDALAKLSGAELAKFRTEFIRAMQDARGSSAEVQTGLRLIGEQAAKSLGVDLVAASNKVGDSFKKADEAVRLLILSMPALKAAGVDAGQVVGEALSKMLDGAKSQAEIEAVIKRVQALRKELGEKLADGLLSQAKQKAEELKDAMEGITPGIQSVREAMKLLGITTDATLQDSANNAKQAYDTMKASGLASARELGEAFRKTAEAAIAANQGIAPAWVKAEAAARGYKVEVDEAGKSHLELINRAAPGLERLARGWHTTREAIQAQQDALDKLAMKYTMTADYTERQIALLEREAAAAEKAAEAYRKKWNMDKEGYSMNTAGERVNAGESQADVDKDVAKRYGVENVENADAQRARQLAKMLGFIADQGGLISDPGTSQQIADMRRELQELEAKLLNSAPGSETSSGPSPIAPAKKANRGGGTFSGEGLASPASTDAPPNAVPSPGAANGLKRVVNIFLPNNNRVFPVPTDDLGEQSLRAIAEGVVRILEIDRQRTGRY